MQTDKKNNNRYEIYQTGYLIGCLDPIPWVDLGDRASKEKETFSEYCHAAYEIKGTTYDSNMIAII